MKKYIASLIAIMMAFSLCACEYMVEPVDDTVTPAFRISVSFETDTDEAAYEGDTFFTGSFMRAEVASSHSKDSAKRINRAIGELEQSFRQDAEEIKTAVLEGPMAETEGAEQSETPVEAPVYSYNCKAEVLRCDTEVLSIGYFVSGYAGGSHGFEKLVTLNFDSRTGEKLGISDISDDSERFNAFLVNYLVSLAGGEEYMLNGERVIDEDDRLADTLPEMLEGGSWYFGENAMVVYANPYDIASYDAGIIKFEIPYSTVAEFVDGRFMPVSPAGESGIILAEDGEKCDRDHLNIIRSITLDEGAQSVILSAYETVYNVKLYTLVENEDGSAVKTSLWNRNYMSTSDAVEVISYIPDVFPLVYIEYSLADGAVITRGTFQSG